MKEADAAGKLSPDRLVLLGRLQLQVGDTDDAIATYERALAGGSQLTMLKNDYAYLLARTGRDLDRALQLAKESAAAERDSLSAADTLGYVYLRAGNADAAFWQFRYVTANAEPPVAQYQYHLALALMELDRDAEARIALERALAIDPQFADAKSAREELARLSAAAAKPVESS
jgi:tetratricopeptide (TPR) repeat protein